MRLETEFFKMPLLFNVDQLKKDIHQFSASDWQPSSQGQLQSSLLPLITAKDAPGIAINADSMQPTAHLSRCPYITQVLASLNTILGRTQLVRTSTKTNEPGIVDASYHGVCHARIIIPIETDADVEFFCNGEGVHMAAGEAWVIDTFRAHYIVNPQSEPRIHLMIDTVGSEPFWQMVAGSEKPFAADAGSQVPVRRIPFDAEQKVKLQFEKITQAPVMSPGEQEALADLVLEEASVLNCSPDEPLTELEDSVLVFKRQWRALWARFCDRPDGWPHFRRVLEDFKGQIRTLDNQLPLSNGLQAVQVIRQLLIQPALQAKPDGPEANVSTEKISAPPSISARDISSIATIDPQPTLAVPKASPMPVPAPQQSQSQSPSQQSNNDIKEPLTVSGQATAKPDDRINKNVRARFERPVFIVSAPRAGGLLLLKLLSRSPSVYTVGGDSQKVFGQIRTFNPAGREYDSNRQLAKDADPLTVKTLKTRFRALLRDRKNKALPEPAKSFRLLEHSPKNALRVQFLNAAFTGARFIFLVRDARESISSIMEAWRSGRAVTFPNLPQWPGLPWSFLLISEWRALKDKPLEEIALAQWSVANKYILHDFNLLERERWCAVSYANILADPKGMARRLCTFAGIDRDEEGEDENGILGKLDLPPSGTETLEKNATELERVLPETEAFEDRLRTVLAEHAPPPLDEPEASDGQHSTLDDEIAK